MGPVVIRYCRDGTVRESLNLGQSVLDGTVETSLPPVESTLSTGTAVVPAKRVVEAGSPYPAESPEAASR